MKTNYINASQTTSGHHRLKHFFKDSNRKRRGSRSPDPLTTIDELRCRDSVFKELRNTKKCYGEGNGTPLQYSCLENLMDGGAQQAAVHGVAKSRTRLSDFTFTFHFHALEREMATRSRVLAWRIPGTEEPGGLLSMGSHRVGQQLKRLSSSSSKKC